MNILRLLQAQFSQALSGLVANPAEYVTQIRRSQEPKFGDYQANFCMPLAKQLDRPSREVAQEVAAQLDLGEWCEPAEVAGPGFINVRFRDDWLAAQLLAALRDPTGRLAIAPADHPQTFVVDYSGPNVAKPMHVGHVRSTVIGDCLVRTLRFLGHRVIGDNHIGDWGTQFGMILYGYRQFRDEAAYRANPVHELARLYRLVRKLVDYHAGVEALPRQRGKLAAQAEEQAALANSSAAADPAAKKKLDKTLRQLERSAAEAREALAELEAKLAEVERSPELSLLAAEHATIQSEVLAETAKLHVGEPENLRLWKEFLPPCLEDIERIYRRLQITFDCTFGESFYHDRLERVVVDLKQAGLARESDGAVAVFLAGQPVPLLVQKQDGAFLYATTDLATIQYRVEKWQPDAILYVVDHRQSLHFAQLFETARRWGYGGPRLEHVSFGTVLGDDGRPFKTRSGDVVGLEGLLDEAVRRAAHIVGENDDRKPTPELSAAARQQVAEAVGIGALKYADLSQNRTSDYVFSYDKMLAMQGNTATYMQYAHARVRSIFAKGKVDIAALVNDPSAQIVLAEPAERALAMELLGFAEALDSLVADFRPNQLTTYLFELANRYSTFFENCPVLKAENAAQKTSRLLLCELTAQTIRLGLELLGIQAVERM
ncbi:MAG TPA: arginine--tRNA ligase [Pirellulales bacterium]|jgi:arginyl-tRNA synthetase|nr:arginine--tRNA ligase [Pirellulales bacterium]